MEQATEKFDEWGIVEVMGHKKFAGHITEQTIAGSALIRIDVPETTARKSRWVDGDTVHEREEYDLIVAAYTKLIGVGSIYAITPTTEEIARAAAAEIAKYDSDPLPVQLPERRALPAPATVPADEYDADWDDVQDGEEDERI